MASSLWKSLVEAINLGPEWPTKGMSGPHSYKIEGKPQPQMVWEELEPDAVSKMTSEHRGVMGDPDVAQSRDDAKDSQVLMGEASFDSDQELGDSREELPSEELTAQIVVNKPISTSIPNASCVSCPASSVSQIQHNGEEFDALGHSDLLEDAKFYQDAVVEYQSAYYSIQDKYTHQAHLLEEASGALQAAESWASQTQQELLTLKRSCNADIQKAVSNAVSQYQMQLTAAQSHTHKHQLAIQQLWDQVCTLELSLASQADLPSMGKSQGEVDLQEEVFNILPGTVNATQGTAVYHSSDQAFSFHKQVQFGDRPNQPDLKLDADLSDQVSSSSHNLPHSWTPYCTSAIPTNPLNHQWNFTIVR